MLKVSSKSPLVKIIKVFTLNWHVPFGFILANYFLTSSLMLVAGKTDPFVAPLPIFAMLSCWTLPLYFLIVGFLDY